MRTTVLAVATSMAVAAAASADIQIQVTPAPKHKVYLYGTADLDRLQSTNPNHYARAQRILAAANKLCRPGPEQVQFAEFDAKDLSCATNLLWTSNPPQRQVTFTLDDTRYIALVMITDDPPRVTHAH